MLLQAWEATPEAEGSLRAQIVVMELAANALVNSGTITASSTSGRSTSLAQSRQGEKTLLETADAWTQLRDLFDSTVKYQNTLTPPGATDDQTIYNLMNLSPELLGITGYKANSMWLVK